MSSIDTSDVMPFPAQSIESTDWRLIDRRLFAADLAVQVSHRAAILTFFAFLTVLGLLYVGNQETVVTWSAGAMFAFADIGLCAALLGRTMLKPSKLRREATVVLLFNATLLVLSLQLMLITRLDLIRSVAQAFFKPD